MTHTVNSVLPKPSFLFHLLVSYPQALPHQATLLHCCCYKGCYAGRGHFYLLPAPASMLVFLHPRSCSTRLTSSSRTYMWPPSSSSNCPITCSTLCLLASPTHYTHVLWIYTKTWIKDTSTELASLSSPALSLMLSSTVQLSHITTRSFTMPYSTSGPWCLLYSLLKLPTTSSSSYLVCNSLFRNSTALFTGSELHFPSEACLLLPDLLRHTHYSWLCLLAGNSL